MLRHKSILKIIGSSRKFCDDAVFVVAKYSAHFTSVAFFFHLAADVHCAIGCVSIEWIWNNTFIPRQSPCLLCCGITPLHKTKHKQNILRSTRCSSSVCEITRYEPQSSMHEANLMKCICSLWSSNCKISKKCKITKIENKTRMKQRT